MSKGFGESDFAQIQGDRITSETVRRVIDEGLEQAAHAAQRRSEGSYGICEECGERIADERLKVLPDATRCINCQSRLAERGI